MVQAGFKMRAGRGEFSDGHESVEIHSAISNVLPIAVRFHKPANDSGNQLFNRRKFWGNVEQRGKFFPMLQQGVATRMTTILIEARLGEGKAGVDNLKGAE